MYKRRFTMSWGPATVFIHRKLSAEEHAAAILSLITCDVIPGTSLRESTRPRLHLLQPLLTPSSVSCLVGVEAEVWSRNKQDVVAAGGIAPLTQLLRTGSGAAKRHAASALAQLTRNGDGMPDCHRRARARLFACLPL